MKVKEVLAIRIDRKMIILRTFEDYEKAAELCNCYECSTLMSLMEDAFNIPLKQDEKFWNEHKEIMKLYSKIVKQRDELFEIEGGNNNE